MPDIPNKGRILRFLQYLYLNTDEEHAATTQDLIDALAVGIHFSWEIGLLNFQN